MMKLLPRQRHAWRLARVRAQNFRAISHLDATIPPKARVVCFVGPNGGGKSSLLSVLSRALQELHAERLGADISPRTWSVNEIGPRGDALGVTFDTLRDSESRQYTVVVHRDDAAALRDAGDLAQTFGVKLTRGQTFHGGWVAPAPQQEAGSLAGSVLLVRPADRSERPYYEEASDSSSHPTTGKKWVQERLLPAVVRSGAIEAEQFILDMLLTMAYDDSAHQKVAAHCVQTLSTIVRDLTSNPFNVHNRGMHVQSWPYRRVGPEPLQGMSLLSSAEVDVVVTAAAILSQQVYIAERLNLNWLPPEPGPGGVVIIDEVDLHWHPQMQRTVLSTLLSAFPEIQFVVSTHSPFVVRALPAEESVVVRLPDGAMFSDDFGSWTIDDVLSVIFEAPPGWSDATANELRFFEQAVSMGDVRAVVGRYQRMSKRSTFLQAELDRILALLGTAELRDAVHRGKRDQ